MKIKSHRKPISLCGNIIAEESLPFPFVHYSSNYGTFLAFGESKQDIPTLCECAKHAVFRYISHRASLKPQLNAHERRMFLVDSFAFPSAVVDWVANLKMEMSIECIDSLYFRSNLCHQCNGSEPSYRWCHEMYGSSFKQSYGWYINQRRIEIGVFEHFVDYAICPDEIRDLLLIDPNTFIETYSRLAISNYELSLKFNKEYLRQIRQVDRIIENTIRERMGMRPMGSGSTGESMLFQLAKRIFPRTAVHRCSRPEFLAGLELDVFLPEVSIAFEYQGQQHYQPVAHWGGEDGLRLLKARDARKRELCEANGVRLFELRFDEPITEGSLRRALNAMGIVWPSDSSML